MLAQLDEILANDIGALMSKFEALPTSTPPTEAMASSSISTPEPALRVPQQSANMPTKSANMPPKPSGPKPGTQPGGQPAADHIYLIFLSKKLKFLYFLAENMIIII